MFTGVNIKTVLLGLIVFLIMKFILKDLLKRKKRKVEGIVEENKPVDQPTKEGGKDCNGECVCEVKETECDNRKVKKKEPEKLISEVKIVYGTTTGRAEYFAKQLEKRVKDFDIEVEVENAADYNQDVEEKLVALAKSEQNICSDTQYLL